MEIFDRIKRIDDERYARTFHDGEREYACDGEFVRWRLSKGAAEELDLLQKIRSVVDAPIVSYQPWPSDTATAVVPAHRCECDVSQEVFECDKCHGEGVVYCSSCTHYNECTKCQGEGTVSYCCRCGGVGWISPPGRNGMTIINGVQFSTTAIAVVTDGADDVEYALQSPEDATSIMNHVLHFRWNGGGGLVFGIKLPEPTNG